jgi:hypothetical protein
MNNVVRTKAFPTLIYEIDCSELVGEVRKLLSETNFIGPNSFVSDSFYVLNDQLKLKFEEKVNSAISELEYQIPFKVSTSWFTRTEPNKTIHKHRHTNCYWSGSFYFYDDCAPLLITKEKPQIFVPFGSCNPELMMSGTIQMRADCGKLILFPSHMEHYVSENESDRDRYSLAMNFMPHGVTKWYDSEYNYQ